MNYRGIILSTLVVLSAGYVPATLAMDRNKIQEQCKQVLFESIKKGLYDEVAASIELGADVNALDIENRSPLYFACLNNLVNIAKLLIEKGANKEVVSKKGYTPLKIACFKGHVNIVKLLLENGADIETLTDTPSTPLYLALQQGHKDIVELLKNGINRQAEQDMVSPNQLDQIQKTLLFNTFFDACEEGAVEVVSKLIKKGFDVNTKAKDNLTPLHVACGNGHFDIVKLLVANKAKIDAVACGKQTPLSYAFADGKSNIIEFLIVNGANVNFKDSANNTMLHHACFRGNFDLVRLLINHKANINAEGWSKTTPLHSAVMSKNIAIIKHLLEAGANIDTEATNGLTALDCVYDQEDPTDIDFSIMELFEMHGAIIISDEEAEEYRREFFTKLNQENKLEEKVELKVNPQNNVQYGKNRKNEGKKLKHKQATPNNKSNVLAENQLPIEPKDFDKVGCSVIITPNNTTQNAQNDESKSAESVVLITASKPMSITINDKSPVVLKKGISKPFQQQTEKSTKNQIRSNAPRQVIQSTCNEYQVLYPKKWPRSLSRESQKNTMFNHLKQLKKWPDTEGLDLERLKGQMKGYLCIRVGGHRVIFKIDEKKRTILISEIALHHDGYK